MASNRKFQSATNGGLSQLASGGVGSEVLDVKIDGANIAAITELVAANKLLVLVSDVVKEITVANLISTLPYRETFTNADLTDGKITITHELGQKYNPVALYDENGKWANLAPDSIEAIDTDDLELDFTVFGSISGTWNIVVG